ncbi:hypothetical protein Tco_1230375 [Tanacetum coccineum]
MDKKDSDFDEILDDLFILGAENLRRMGQDKQFFNVPDETDEVIQPLILQPIHITPPIDDYVAPATKSILNELLEDKILNVTMVDKEADFNPTKDIEELERFLANEPQSHFMEIQVHSVITKPEPFIHTKPMNLLYEIFESYKSSTKPHKVDREMKSPSRFSLQGKMVRRLALSLMTYYFDHRRPPGIVTFDAVYLKWGDMLFISRNFRTEGLGLWMDSSGV